VVVTAEDGVRLGGAGTHLADAVAGVARAANRPVPPVHHLGLPGVYLAQGRADDLLTSLGLDGKGIALSVRQALAAAGRTATAMGAVPAEEQAGPLDDDRR
jgi:1-deoxy-D-xylulose-5-phosphate synthase